MLARHSIQLRTKLMKRCAISLLSMNGLVLAAFCSFFLQAAHAEQKAFASPPDEGKQAWFLGMLKALADVDALNDPAKVGAILGVKFSKTVVTSGPSHMEAFAKAFERDEYTPIDPPGSLPGHRAMLQQETSKRKGAMGSLPVLTRLRLGRRSPSSTLSRSASGYSKLPLCERISQKMTRKPR